MDERVFFERKLSCEYSKSHEKPLTYLLLWKLLFVKIKNYVYESKKFTILYVKIKLSHSQMRF